MDKYVSTYIGRPLAVFERDYDTRWPDSKEGEGMEEGKAEDVWVDIVKEERGESKGAYEPLPEKVLECFSATSKLCESGTIAHCMKLTWRDSCDFVTHCRGAVLDSSRAWWPVSNC
jgi:hypothetical protein